MKTKHILIAVAVTLVSCCCSSKIDKPTYDTKNTITVNTDQTGDLMWNVVSNVNIWEMGSQFLRARVNETWNVFEFVEYVQLMQCTGGSTSRDLFRDPNNTAVRDDYKFDNLVGNCRGILKLGAKPHLKLGSVPLKLSDNPEARGFGTNIYPPRDYDEYYRYIKAAIEALVKEFGKEEVASWHFGCMTEYENADWFQAHGGNGKDSFVAYCKLYDYTGKALTDVLGDDVYYGAHAMAVTEGLWDETMFIEHVAKGTNYATGKIGSPIKYLAFSFYDSTPGKFTTGKTLDECVKHMRGAAEKYGLTDLKYGVDEGRILNGNVSGRLAADLNNRTCGYTWQAAYDARLYKIAYDNDINYISMWNYLSANNVTGFPNISYHVSSNLAKMSGGLRCDVDTNIGGIESGAEVDAVASIKDNVVRVMIYNFKNDVNYDRKVMFNLKVKVPFKGDVTCTKSLVCDDCNFFDEWVVDRKKLGITENDFAWSPDDPLLDQSNTLQSSAAQRLYKDNVREGYFERATLVPTTETVKVEKGYINMGIVLDPSNVLFLEFKQ